MPSSAEYFHAMAMNNAWANHRLHAACALLKPGEFEAERTAFFPSIQATLNHILIIDRFYVDALEGGSLGYRAFEERIPYPLLAELTAAQRDTDRRLLALTAALAEAGLAREVRMIRQDRVQVDRADRTLLHLFEHQIHHRGQAHAMLSGTSVQPPQLDEFFMAEEAPLRANEFAELGLRETAVWRAG